MVSERAEPMLAATRLNRGKWMFGLRGDEKWPRNLSYSLGYAMASHYVTAHDIKASAAAGIASEDITAAWYAR